MNECKAARGPFCPLLGLRGQLALAAPGVNKNNNRMCCALEVTCLSHA